MNRWTPLTTRLRALAYTLSDAVFRPHTRATHVPPHRTQRLLRMVIFGAAVLILTLRVSEYIEAQMAVAETQRDFDYYQARIVEEQARMDALNAQYAELQGERTERVNAFFTSLPGGLGADSEELKAFQISSQLAGMRASTGPGVRFTLSDKPGIDYTANDRAAIIHDADIRQITNLVKGTMAATAMAVNGERLIATSNMICTGPNILVNRTYTAMPFVLEVTGDPDIIIAAIESSELLANFQRRELGTSIERIDNLTIPPFMDTELMTQSLNTMHVIGALPNE